ncbi:hypothetical protein BJ912DRAFT_928954 [Pholiota molesta]|nr:hypothetical protein BJ912DRAFT_928954 [Pholiota molesta]
MTNGILKAVTQLSREQATSQVNEPGRDIDTSSTTSTLSSGDSNNDIDKSVRTRSSSGISKKRVFPDAAPDVDVIVPTTPPKKARTTAAGRIGSVARHDVALEKDMPPTHSDPFATLDGLSLSPLKLISGSDRRDSPSPSSEFTSTLDGRDMPVSSSAIEFSKRDGKKRASTPVAHVNDPVDVSLSSVEHLHPDEAANIARAILESKQESLSVALQHIGSSASVHDTTSIHIDSKSSLSVPRAKRHFKDVVPRTSEPTPMMASGTVLFDDLNRFQVRALPATCEVNNQLLHDPLLANDYATLPPLKQGSLKSWSNNVAGSSDMERLISFSQWSNQCPNLDFDAACDAIRFVRYGHYINPSRISPLEVNILYTSYDRKRSVLQCNFRTAICISPILSVESYLVEPAKSGLKNKYLSGHFHLQEWQRLAGFSCMVFDRPSLVAQIYNDTISFVTSGPLKAERESYYTQHKALRNPSILMSTPGMGTSRATRSKPIPFKQTLSYTDNGMALYFPLLPVYDAREMPFNFASDFDNIDAVLPTFDGEIPAHSFVVVAYTMTHYDKDGRSNLSTNILFVILFATD